MDYLPLEARRRGFTLRASVSSSITHRCVVLVFASLFPYLCLLFSAVDLILIGLDFLSILFLKFKNSGKFGDKGKFQSSRREKKEFKKKNRKEFQSTQGATCFECNRHGHFKKECLNYLKSKGNVYATTLSESDSSNSDSEESCDEDGNYSAFMTIAHVESSDELNLHVQELGEHIDEESIGIVEESDVEEDENVACL